MSTPVDLEAAPRVTFTEEWCLEMARKEGDSDVTAGVPEVDLEAARKLAEKLRAVRAKGHPGEWRQGSVEKQHVFVPGVQYFGGIERVLLRMNTHFPHEDDCALIVAAVNAAEPLADLVLSLIPEAERARSLIAFSQGSHDGEPDDSRPMHFRCPECGPHVGVDEDGCCRHCGRDATDENCTPACAPVARSLTPEVREGLREIRRFLLIAAKGNVRAALDWIEEHAGEPK